MKATLTFHLPEESEEFNYAVKGAKYFDALEEVRDKVFRPARKHGYAVGSKVHELIEKIGPDAETLIGHLEDMFFQVLEDGGVS